MSVVQGGSPQGTSPMAPHSGEKTPISMTGTQKDTLPSTTGGSAGEGHAGGAMDKIKAAMGGAPWQVSVAQTTLVLQTVRCCVRFMATASRLTSRAGRAASQHCHAVPCMWGAWHTFSATPLLFNLTPSTEL